MVNTHSRTYFSVHIYRYTDTIIKCTTTCIPCIPSPFFPDTTKKQLTEKKYSGVIRIKKKKNSEMASTYKTRLLLYVVLVFFPLSFWIACVSAALFFFCLWNSVIYVYVVLHTYPYTNTENIQNLMGTGRMSCAQHIYTNLFYFNKKTLFFSVSWKKKFSWQTNKKKVSWFICVCLQRCQLNVSSLHLNCVCVSVSVLFHHHHH